MEQQRSTTAMVPLASTDTNESNNLEKRLTLLKGNTFMPLAAISEPSPGDEVDYNDDVEDDI